MLRLDVRRQHHAPELAHPALVDRIHHLAHRSREIVALQLLLVRRKLRTAEQRDPVAAATGFRPGQSAARHQLRAVVTFLNLVARQVLEALPEDAENGIRLLRGFSFSMVLAPPTARSPVWP
jgi:hypothetical protein